MDFYENKKKILIFLTYLSTQCPLLCLMMAMLTNTINYSYNTHRDDINRKIKVETRNRIYFLSIYWYISRDINNIKFKILIIIYPDFYDN